MRKINLLLCALFSMAGLVKAASPIAEYTFDGTTGNGKLEGEVRYESGVQGKAIVLKDSTVTIPCPQKLTTSGGTITFWMKPLNWDSESKEFMTPLCSERKDGTGRMMFYKYNKAGGLGLMLWFGNPSERGKNIYAANFEHEKLQKGKWHFIALTWNKGSHLLALSLDGKQITSKKLDDTMFFAGFGPFVLNQWPFNPYNRSYETAFDMLRFYGKPLTEEQVKKHFEREPNEVKPISPKAVMSTIISLPKMKKLPKVDGHFIASEWTDAARGGGFYRLDGLQLVTDTYSDAYLGSDGSKLYFCCITKIADATSLVNKFRKRDQPIHQDDAWEVHLVPPGMKAGSYYQTIVNYAGAIYDALTGDKSWTGSWDVKSGIYEGMWICEMSIPLSDFHQTFQQDSTWQFNICRDLQFPELAKFEFSSLVPVTGSFFGSYGSLRLTERDSYGRLTIDYELLAKRKLHLNFEVVNQAAAAQTFKVEFQKLSADGQVMETKAMTQNVPAGKGHAFAYEDPLSGFTSGIFRVIATNGKGTVIHRQDIPMVFKDEVMISMDTKLSQGLLTFDIDMNSHYKLRKTARIDATIRSSDGRSQTVHPAMAAMVKGAFNLTAVTPGDCVLEFVFRNELGQKLLSYKKNYKHIGQPAWLKEHAGTNMGVIAPYTPIRRQGNALSVLGRTHMLGTSILPEQIISQGVKLFTKAPELTARYHGKNVMFNNVQFKPVKEADDEVIMTFTASAGELQISGTFSLEYDGFFWYEFSLNQPKVILDELSMNLFLPEQVASFVNGHFFDRENYVGKLTTPRILKQLPSLWTGNTEVGLTLVTESFQHWQNRDPNAAFTFTSRNQSVKWQVRLVDKPTDLSKTKLSYAFGVEANPVKPVPKNYRSLRVNSFYNATISHPWDIDFKIKKYKDDLGFHTPEHVSMEAFRQEVKHFRDQGKELSLYLNPYLLSTESTEYKTFLKEWRNPYSGYPLCPASSFTDYTTWQIKDHIKRGGLRCVYVDSLGATNCANPLHGCGYVDEQGNQKLTWPIRGMRNYMKRLYSLIHAPGFDSPSNHLWGHMSARTSAPIDAFVDFQCSGEELETLIMTNSNYLELYNMDEFQVFYNKSSGVMPMLLPNLGRCGPKENRWKPKYNDQLLALVLLHDVQLWPCWCYESYVNNIYRKLDAFGLLDPAIQFHSYRHQTLIATSVPNVYISIYQLGSKAMAVVVNKNGSDKIVDLHVDFEKLGISASSSVTDVREEKTISNDNPLKIKVLSYNFKLIQIGK